MVDLRLPVALERIGKQLTATYILIALVYLQVLIAAIGWQLPQLLVSMVLLCGGCLTIHRYELS